MTDEPAAKAAYEEMLRRQGVSPVHTHAWENQDAQVRRDWVGAVRAAVAAERAKWKAVVLKMDIEAETIDEKGVALMTLARLLRNEGP